MKFIKIVVPVFSILLIAIASNQCYSQFTGNSPERDRLFNYDWKFIRDSISGAELPEFDDSNWMQIDLPHDFSIMNLPDQLAGLPGSEENDQIGPFSKKSSGNGNSTGHVVGGTGWYRKTFILEKAEKGKTAILNFDGVYMESELWVNGRKVGEHKNGYTPFMFNITPFLNKPGIPNIIAVKVENNGRNSRWYSGSGIYRNVHLTLVQPIYVAPWGVYISTPEVHDYLAIADIQIIVQNDESMDSEANITVNVKNRNGQLIAVSSENVVLPSKGSKTIEKQIEIKNPDIWTLENPNLYTAEIIVNADQKVTDKFYQIFGIRTIDISAEKGFLLNNKPLLLKGGCLHHDNGLLGAAAYDRAEVRKVELMKANGYNAIRFSHNPPSEAILYACDDLGMLVINEFTDMWESYKNPQDYSQFFREHWDANLRNMILRDRNHPSIIMWSIGNEILKSNVEDATRIGRQLSDQVRELDNTRYVTEAVTSLFTPGGWENSDKIFEILDVSGYNYQMERYESDHEDFPQRVIYGSESFPLNAYEYWDPVEKHPYVIGDFVWSAMDYIGEVSISKSTYVPEAQKQVFKLPESLPLPPGVNVFDFMERMPSSWPYFVSGCGDLDITGEKKPQSLYRDVLWNESQIEMNVHEDIQEGMAENVSGWGWPREFSHWNWKENEGKKLLVRVFTKASDVKLELNGNEIGEKSLADQDKYIAIFEVPYQQGELTAIAIENGKEIGRKVLKTAGGPDAIRLVADRDQLASDRNDLSFIKIEVVDKDGLLVPTSSIHLNLEVTGNGELIASGNANPADMESVNSSLIRTYNGKAQAVIRALNTGGDIKLSVKSDGLSGNDITIQVH